MKQTCFSYFLCGFKIKTSVYAWACDEQPRTCEEQLRTFKHIQRNLNDYYHALILNSHHGNTKNPLSSPLLSSSWVVLSYLGLPETQGIEWDSLFLS